MKTMNTKKLLNTTFAKVYPPDGSRCLVRKVKDTVYFVIQLPTGEAMQMAFERGRRKERSVKPDVFQQIWDNSTTPTEQERNLVLRHFFAYSEEMGDYAVQLPNSGNRMTAMYVVGNEQIFFEKDQDRGEFYAFTSLDDEYPIEEGQWQAVWDNATPVTLPEDIIKKAQNTATFISMTDTALA